MAEHYELVVSASDAEALSRMLGAHGAGADLEAAGALADLLSEARLVAHERLPWECVALNSQVTYLDESCGEQRNVTLVHPNEADPAAACISVLTPVGRALLGRRPGAVIAMSRPDGSTRTLRILGVERNPVTPQSPLFE